MTTGDPVEAMTLPDRLVVLEGGRIAQVGAPMDVYQRPETLVAAACTGDMSMVDVRVEGDADGLWLTHPAFRRHAPQNLADYVGASVVMAMRPAWAHLEPDGLVPAIVTEASPGSSSITVALDVAGVTNHVVIRVASRGHRRGDRVAFDIDEVALFDPTTGTRL